MNFKKNFLNLKTKYLKKEEKEKVVRNLRNLRNLIQTQIQMFQILMITITKKLENMFQHHHIPTPYITGGMILTYIT